MSAAPRPKKIGRYRVESELGRGMMGVVYRGLEPRSKRRVALKVIRVAFAVSEEQRRSFERRFLEEARIVARLSHPGIVKLHELGEDAALDAPFIALEYLEGRTLAAVLAEGARPAWRESLRIVARVAEALHYAHSQGVVHRDIKPGNVMLLPSGEPKIMDFGLAKLSEAGLDLTSTGQFMGTPLYMAPEQALGQAVDGRTDLFSLGSILYTLLTGRRAFEAESVPQVLNKVTYQQPVLPSRLERSLPADVDYVVARALAKDRAERYQDGRQLAGDIEDVLAGRKPRHRGGWKMPEMGEGTMVAQRPLAAPPAVEADELSLIDDVAPDVPAAARGSRRRRGHRPVALLTLSMLALGGVLYSSAFWRARVKSLWVPAGSAPLDAFERTSSPPAPPLPSPVPASPSPAAPAADSGVAPAAAAPATEPSAPPVTAAASPGSSTPADNEGDDPAPDAVVDAADDEPDESAASSAAPSSPRAVPSATPSARPPSPAASGSPSTTSSRLSIVLEHHVRRGTVRVWVDDKLVLQQLLRSRVTHDLLLFKLRTGSAKEVLPVRSGRRRIRVRVDAEAKASARDIVGVFKPGVTHRLQANVGHVGGPMELSWR